MGPNPIFARHPYYPTKCELCGWVGSSEQCRVYSNGDDADVGCPACDQIFLCDEIETEELNAAVVAQARAEGFRLCQERAAATIIDAADANGQIYVIRAAAKVRALKVEGE